MNDNAKTGLLLSEKNIKLQRQYFREMVKLLGINVIYRAPLPGKHYTTYAELDSNYAQPLVIGCLFEDHPTQQTLKKLGWMSELNDSSVVIQVDYDLPGLQQGALFILPSGIDNSKGRLFRLVKMQTSMVYPASITCELVPEYEDTMDQEVVNDYSRGSFNLVSEEHDTPQFLEPNEFNMFNTLQSEDDYL